MPKYQLKKCPVNLKRISKGEIEESASKSLKVTIYRKVAYYKQNHFVRYFLKNNQDKESRKLFSKKIKKDNVNTKPKFTSIKKPAAIVPTFLGLPLEVSPPPSPSYSCEADGKFDCYDFSMSCYDDETIVPFKNGKRTTAVLDSASNFEDFKSPLSKKKTSANFVDTFELKHADKKLYEKECKWCLNLFYTKKSENIFCKKCNKLKDGGDTDEEESKKVKWKKINKKCEGGKKPRKSSKVTSCGSKRGRNEAQVMGKEKLEFDADASKKKKMKSSETNCDIVISQKDINTMKTVKSKSKAAPKILGGKRSNKDTNIMKTVESNFKATPKNVGKKKRKKSLQSTCDSLGSQKDKDNCDIVSSADLGDLTTPIAKITRTWGNAVNVEKILSGIYQLTFPSDDIEIEYVHVHEPQVEGPEVSQTLVSHMHTLPCNVSRTENDKQEQHSVSKTVIKAKEELEAISLLAYLDMDDDIHQVLRNLYKTEYKKYRHLKRNRDTNALFKKGVRFQQRKLKTLTMANTLLQKHGTYKKLAETIMGEIPSEITEDSISPNFESIALPYNLNYGMDASQEQLKSTIFEPLTFPTAEVNLERCTCNTHNESDNLEIKNCICNLVLATSSTISALPCSTPQPVVEASCSPANIEAPFVPRNVGTERLKASRTARKILNLRPPRTRKQVTIKKYLGLRRPSTGCARGVRSPLSGALEGSYSLPESMSSSLLSTAQPFAPQSDHESRRTPSTGSGLGMPSRPESARLELEDYQGTSFVSTEDGMTRTTTNCIAGEECQTRSPASCLFSQSGTHQDLQDVRGLLNYSKDMELSHNAIALEIQNNINLQTALLYEINQQQNHQPINQIQSLSGFDTFTAGGQFCPHVHEQQHTTALSSSQQQLLLPTYQQHFNAVSYHVAELTEDYTPVQSFAIQSHHEQSCQSTVAELPSSGGTPWCNPSYNIESFTNDVTIGNHHFFNVQPPNHLQTDLEASTSYNVLEPYTSTQYTKYAITSGDFLGLE